ncbi:MAG: alternative ribosome rescue aminoacyl-tRNA hydrolase ArfB [Deltaproteobacteria bacterium]|jgi:ribosome-associated protein
MISVTPLIAINEDEITLDFIRASGPGGQNVNKVATAVQLRFDVKHSPSLPNDVRARLVSLGGRKITDDGMLIIEAKRFRTQDRNRQDALDRLMALVRKAAERPKPRIKTKPSSASKKRKLEAKRHRSRIKQMRRPVGRDND